MGKFMCRPEILVLGLAASLGAAASVNAQTLPYDHVHLAVADPARAVEWYIKYMDGTASPRPDRVVFGTTLVIFQKADGRAASAGGAVDHIGFSFADLDARMRMLERDGVKILAPARDMPLFFRLAFIEDPWGVKVELMQDPDSLGFNHIHLLAADPSATLSWYERMFGGERTKLNGSADAVRYGNVWLLAQPGQPAVDERRAIDHLSWRVADVDAATARLRASGVKVVAEPGSSPGGNRVSFVEGPSGVRIEIMQRPQ
jgi:catechol 2,3-dioxygenase-like lactoylglutathione lyase family enzyme